MKGHSNLDSLYDSVEGVSGNWVLDSPRLFDVVVLLRFVLL